MGNILATEQAVQVVADPHFDFSRGSHHATSVEQTDDVTEARLAFIEDREYLQPQTAIACDALFSGDTVHAGEDIAITIAMSPRVRSVDDNFDS